MELRKKVQSIEEYERGFGRVHKVQAGRFESYGF